MLCMLVNCVQNTDSVPAGTLSGAKTRKDAVPPTSWTRTRGFRRPPNLRRWPAMG